MYQHKLVPEGIEPSELNEYYNSFISEDYTSVFKACDTIPLPSPWTAEQLTALASITREEWNIIFGYFVANEVVRAGYAGVGGNTLLFETKGGISFSQYLSDLLTLAPLKGLSREQIEELRKIANKP